MRRAAAIACVDDAVTSFPEGYDTIVGERGVTLSGGQKQRVAIARMLMQQAPVMIFDDSLSAVDAETDEKIRTALRRVHRQCHGAADLPPGHHPHAGRPHSGAGRRPGGGAGDPCPAGGQARHLPGYLQHSDAAVPTGRCWRKGGASMAAIDEKEYTQSFDWKIWKRLGPFLRPYRGAFVSMLVFNGICALVDVVLPLFQKYAIQNFIEKNTLTGLLPYALAYLAVILVQALSVVIFARNSMHIEMNLGKDMRGTLFHHLQTLSFSFYNVTPVGYLLTRVMSDTNRISSMLAWNFTDILWAVFYVLGTFAAMLALNWRLALAVIAIVPVMAILTGYFQNRILHWNRKVRKLNSRITGAFNEGITGARTTKTLVIGGADRRRLPQSHPADARLRHPGSPAQCGIYPAGAVLRHHGGVHRAAAGRLHGAGSGAGAGHSVGLYRLRRQHLRPHPDDRRQSGGIHLAAGLH